MAENYPTENDHLRALFEFAPISLWEEDYSGVKRLLDGLRARGVTDLRRYIREHPDFVRQCLDALVVLDVNRRTLELFHAASRAELLASLPRIFCDQMRTHFTDELVDMWNGKTFYEREGINYTLDGEPIDIHLQWTILPGFEQTFARVLVSITDITARKRAEEYLKYLGTHDVMTGLFNRAYFVEQRDIVEQHGPFPVSIIIIDMDGLKQVNDRHGHEEGDDLLRRMAEVLKTAFPAPAIITRLGGDEFAVLLPGTGQEAVREGLENIRRLIDLNNNYYSGPTLHASLGAATASRRSRLAHVMRRADDAMYAEKRLHHRHAH